MKTKNELKNLAVSANSRFFESIRLFNNKLNSTEDIPVIIDLFKDKDSIGTLVAPPLTREHKEVEWALLMSILALTDADTCVYNYDSYVLAVPADEMEFDEDGDPVLPNYQSASENPYSKECAMSVAFTKKDSFVITSIYGRDDQGKINVDDVHSDFNESSSWMIDLARKLWNDKKGMDNVPNARKTWVHLADQMGVMIMLNADKLPEFTDIAGFQDMEMPSTERVIGAIFNDYGTELTEDDLDITDGFIARHFKVMGEEE
tara:strand:+ start:6232 stop:7014 length:783 start_codon:yes stop_codon:yes gene_type:complete